MIQHVKLSGSAEMSADYADDELVLDERVVFIVEGIVSHVGQTSTATQGTKDVASVKLSTIMRVEGKEANKLRERLASWRAAHGDPQLPILDAEEV